MTRPSASELVERLLSISIQLENIEERIADGESILARKVRNVKRLIDDLESRYNPPPIEIEPTKLHTLSLHTLKEPS